MKLYTWAEVKKACETLKRPLRYEPATRVYVNGCVVLLGYTLVEDE